MRIKVGFIGLPNVTAEYTLDASIPDDAKEMQNMTASNFKKVAFAVIRRRHKLENAFPINVSGNLFGGK
jgi:hypothetical protein